MHTLYYVMPTYILSYIICRYSYKSFLEYRERIGIKPKYGARSTIVIESMALTMIVMLLLYYMRLDSGPQIVNGVAVVMVLFVVFGMVRHKVLYAYPHTKQNKEMKNYGYYLIEKPATYFRKSLAMPPVNRHGKQNVKKLVQYNKQMEDSAPAIVQFIFLLLLYGITILSFSYTGLLAINASVASFIFMFFPFTIFLMLLGKPLFAFIGLIIKIFALKLPELMEYIIFNFMFVAILNVVALMILEK